jgi:hypothetical protein
MNTDVAIDLFRLSGTQIQSAIEPIPDERMAEQFGGAVNHPAWTMAHLCVAIDFALMLLGAKGVAPESWMDLAKPGTIPTSDRATYPPKDELLATFKRAHEALESAVRSADDAMSRQMPIEAFRDVFPTIAHGAAYFLMSHEPAHMAQLADWKRGSDV